MKNIFCAIGLSAAVPASIEALGPLTRTAFALVVLICIIGSFPWKKLRL